MAARVTGCLVAVGLILTGCGRDGVDSQRPSSTTQATSSVRLTEAKTRAIAERGEWAEARDRGVSPDYGPVVHVLCTRSSEKDVALTLGEHIRYFETTNSVTSRHTFYECVIEYKVDRVIRVYNAVSPDGVYSPLQ